MISFGCYMIVWISLLFHLIDQLDNFIEKKIACHDVSVWGLNTQILFVNLSHQLFLLKENLSTEIFINRVTLFSYRTQYTHVFAAVIILEAFHEHDERFMSSYQHNCVDSASIEMKNICFHWEWLNSNSSWIDIWKSPWSILSSFPFTEGSSYFKHSTLDENSAHVHLRFIWLKRCTEFYH